MRVMEFIAEDYINMQTETGHGFQSWSNSEVPLEWVLLSAERRTTSRTIKDDNDKIWAIYGMVKLWDGVCEVFFIPAKGWKKHHRQICKFVMEDLKTIIDKFHRIQLVCKNQPRFLRFADFFGFSQEGILHNYDAFKNDYVMLSRVGG